MKSQEGREPRRFRRGSETERESELGYSLIEVPVQAVGLDATTKIFPAASPAVKYALDIPFYRASRHIVTNLATHIRAGI